MVHTAQADPSMRREGTQQPLRPVVSALAMGLAHDTLPNWRNRKLDHIRTHIDDPEIAAVVEAAVRWSNTESEAQLAISKILGDKIKDLAQQRSTAESDRRKRERQDDALGEMASWLELPRFVLEPVQDSVLHKALSNHFPIKDFVSQLDAPSCALRSDYSVFLIQHDWASLVEAVTADAGDVRLPFEACCFEAAISGRRVCALVECDQGEPVQMVTMLWTRLGWFYPDLWHIEAGELTRQNDGIEDFSRRVASLLWLQIRAIAITLDAEVTCTVPVRAPHVANAQRIKRGQLPLFDHRVLTLARRSRAADLPASAATDRHPRAHFRRGHWRHYQSHKTWIKWMLVGDLRRGFADKHYRLAADGASRQDETPDAIPGMKTPR